VEAAGVELHVNTVPSIRISSNHMDNQRRRQEMTVKSTKAWHKLPCAHAQHFDKEPDGSPGECASWHGYDRSVVMTFAGEIDEMGWIVPFGELRDLKRWIEYYFDHTAVVAANDPRLELIKEANAKIENAGPAAMFQLRVLPFGVSMEMSSLFIWHYANPFIMSVTNGRCYVEKVECIEHDSNSAFVEFDKQTAVPQRSRYEDSGEPLLPCREEFLYFPPQQYMKNVGAPIKKLLKGA